MSVILLLARLILAVVFGISGVAKLADPAGSRKSMTGFGLPESLATRLAWLLPLAEIICAVALLPLAFAWWGASGLLVLLLCFTVAIAVNLVRGRRPDCHCFGQLHSTPIGWKTLVRNTILAAIAALLVLQGPDNPGASVLSWSNGNSSAVTILAVAVAALAAFELWALIHVLRQNGRLLLRIESVEEKLANVALGSPTQPAPLGLPVGTEAPAFTLPDVEEGSVSLETLLERNKPIILMFSEPGCGACEAAIPEVAQWQRDYRDKLLIVPISRGAVKENRIKGAKYDLRNVLLQTDREVAQAYLVDGTPSAVVVRDGRIDSAVSVGIDAIRGLVAHATLPPPVKPGDLVPSLRLPDLSGKLIDLAQFQTRRTLMLFWSPSCGFCQQMLEDLKKWEDSAKEDSPELVVIAAGALDENRKQGFRSRVLLDPYYAASQVFNSGGTPSAILVDQGRVASGVAVGADAVLELARAR